MKRRQVIVIALFVLALAIVTFMVTKFALHQDFYPDFFLFIGATAGVVTILAGFKNVLELYDRLFGTKKPEPTIVNPPVPVPKSEPTPSPSQFPQPSPLS